MNRLLLYAPYALCRPDAQTQAQVQALATLIRGGWARGGWAESALFDVRATPHTAGAPPVAADAIVTPETAAAIFDSWWNLDVTEQASQVQAPTLVIHRRDDALIPCSWGRDVAARIPGARFLPLPGTSHIFRPGEPEGDEFVAAVIRFLGDDAGAESEPAQRRTARITGREGGSSLTARETEVLRLIAQGHSNQEVAAQLSLSVHTVNRHAANIYRRLGARGRAEAVATAVSRGLL